MRLLGDPVGMILMAQRAAFFRTPYQHKRQLISLKLFGGDLIKTLDAIVDYQTLEKLEIDQEDPMVVVFL
jgi:hypothetical protein